MENNIDIAAPKPSTNLLKRAWAVVRADWKAYIGINILYYGLVALGMIYVSFFNPELQKNLVDSIGQSFTQGPLAAVGGAYRGGQVIPAMLWTFVINLFLGTLIEMTLPSLVIPFSGLLMGVVRAILWGLLLSPADARLAGPMIPHSLVLILEGQGYILALLAVFIHGKAILRPGAYGVQGRVRGYVEGLRRTGWIYLLVTVVLTAAAVYEALEVIFLAPLLR
jgi:hypothetical protein